MPVYFEAHRAQGLVQLRTMVYAWVPFNSENPSSQPLLMFSSALVRSASNPSALSCAYCNLEASPAAAPAQGRSIHPSIHPSIHSIHPALML